MLSFSSFREVGEIVMSVDKVPCKERDRHFPVKIYKGIWFRNINLYTNINMNFHLRFYIICCLALYVVSNINMTQFYGSFNVRLLLINALTSCIWVRLLTSQKIKIHKAYTDDCLENAVNILSECTSAIAKWYCLGAIAKWYCPSHYFDIKCWAL